MAENFSNITATTELEAVNNVLMASGEQPMPSGTVLEFQTRPDVVAIIQMMRTAIRELQTEPWKFNTEEGRRFVKKGTFLWTDNDGSTLTLGIYSPPAAPVISWEMTPCVEMRDLDLVLKVSDQYQELGAYVPVLYDRYNHRDGVDNTKHPFIYLDVQYVLDFVDLPECARRYVTALVARRYAQGVLGSAEKSSFSKEDELGSLRLLKREQGRPKKRNFLNNPETAEMMGRDYPDPSFLRSIRNK